MGRRTPRRLLVVVATTALLTAACTGSDSGSSTDSGDDGSGAPSGGSFSIALGSDPSFLAPTAQCYESTCSQVLSMLYTGLLSIDPETSEQVLGDAESIESSDSKVWTVKLKPDLKFHNGEPVDAEAYVRAWNYSAYGPNATQTGFFFSPVEGYADLQAPASGGQPKAQEMSGLKVIDDQTIEITLSEAFSQWSLVMSYTPAFAPLSKECEQDIEACNEQPIGTGPYMMAQPWQHNKLITLTKWDDYTGPNSANADEIEVKLYSDPKTAFRDWQADQVDMLDTVDPSQVPQAQQLAGERFLSVDSGSFNYLGIPFYVEELQDADIRRALSMAIDRQTIVDQVLNGLATPAFDVVAPFVTGSREDACEYCSYDPEAAKTLYDEAGGIEDGVIEIWFNNDGGHEDWVQAVAEGWKNVLGVDYELQSQPFTPYLKTLEEEGIGGPYRLGWIPDYPSAENYLDPVYGEGSSNYGQWAGPEHEAFLDKIAEADAAPTSEAVTIYQEAADIVLEELPVLPLWYGRTSIVYAENLDNVTYDPLQQIKLGDITVS